MKINLKIWRQNSSSDKGYFKKYAVDGISEDMSFLEMMDMLNNNLVENGEYKKIIFWLKNNIHAYGRSVNSMELVRNVSGEELTSTYFVNHLKSKLKDLC